MSGIELGIEGIETASLIGEDDVCAVYRARQEAFNRTVAVKVFRVRSDDAAQRRFEDECRAVMSLSRHPHVVAVYAAGATRAGQPYLAMEYLPRGSLAERLSRDGPLEPDEVIELGIKLAGALAAAHGVGIVHGHVRPESVLLTANGEPQLADFYRVPPGTPTDAGADGMHVATDHAAPNHAAPNHAAPNHAAPNHAAPNHAAPNHAAPEVFAGHALDERSDVYSLGSLLCALLAGAGPFELPEEDSFHPLLDRVFIEEASELRPPGVPQKLWEVIERALSVDREARTPRATVLVDDLEGAKEGREAAVAAAPNILAPRRRSLPKPGRRFAFTRVKVAGSAVLVTAAAVIGTLVLTQPGERPQPTELSASDFPASTTLPGPEPDSTETVPEAPRKSIAPLAPVAPAEAPSSSTTRPTVAPLRPPVVERAPATVTPTTPVPQTSVPSPPETRPPPPPPPEPTTETGTVIGCDSYGQRCDDVPIYRALPPPGSDPGDVSTLATVIAGTELRTRCWSEGARTYNYEADEVPTDFGPDPYQSDIYFNVQVLGETWGWISDTAFVRDKGFKLGLPRC